MSEQNISAARRLIEGLWNKRDLKLADQILASDCRNIDPATPDFGAGPEAYKKLVTFYTKAFPDLRFTVDDLIDGGDRVVVRWTSKGTHKGELRGIAPTGKKITVTGTTICRFANGKIAEQWVTWDALGLMQQLGAMAKTEKLDRAA
jgi:steroid delta-isomerase-like uncharacterized protein